MNWTKLKEQWLREEQHYFKGWNFSHLADGWEEEGLPWDYKELISQYLKSEHQLLDMGTGGGEFLMTLGHPYRNTAVTEAWEPNVELCKNTLEPLGICVKPIVDDARLPFDDNMFDVIINRHEAYDVREIKRILKPGGIFITQQVGGKNNIDLSRRIIENYTSEYADFCLAKEIQKFTQHDFKSLFMQEYFPYLRFFDVGAVVYYAKIIEWEFPGFSVENHENQLKALQKTLEKTGYIESLEHRFVMVAENNKA